MNLHSFCVYFLLVIKVTLPLHVVQAKQTTTVVGSQYSFLLQQIPLYVVQTK